MSSEVSSAFGSRIRTDNLLQAEEVYLQDPVADVLKNIPGDHINQVGVVVFDLKGVVAVELFDHPDSWHAFSKSIIRSYREILTEEAGDLIEIKTDRAEQVFKRFIEKRTRNYSLIDTLICVRDFKCRD